jgi:hypothetical protein
MPAKNNHHKFAFERDRKDQMSREDLWLRKFGFGDFWALNGFLIYENY